MKVARILALCCLMSAVSCRAETRLEPLFCTIVRVPDAEAASILEGRVDDIAKRYALVKDDSNPGTISYVSSDRSVILLHGRNMAFAGSGSVISIYGKGTECSV